MAKALNIKNWMVAGAAAVAAYLCIHKKKGITGVGAVHTISETQLEAYLGSHDIKELVAEYITKNKVECNVGDELGGRSFVLSRSRFIKLFNYCLMRHIPIAVWLGDHWMIRNGGEELISGIGKVDYSDFDGARVIAKDGSHGIEFNIYRGGGVVVSSIYKGKGKYGSIWEYLSHIGEYKTLSGAIKAAKKYWDEKGIRYNPKDFENL